MHVFYIPENKVLVVVVTVLLVLLPNTAVTLTKQWLPGSAGSMREDDAPLSETVECGTNNPHKS